MFTSENLFNNSTNQLLNIQSSRRWNFNLSWAKPSHLDCPTAVVVRQTRFIHFCYYPMLFTQPQFHFTARIVCGNFAWYLSALYADLLNKQVISIYEYILYRLSLTLISILILIIYLHAVKYLLLLSVLSLLNDSMNDKIMQNYVNYKWFVQHYSSLIV